MQSRIAAQNWSFVYDPLATRRPLKERVLDWFEGVSGIRIGEYRNYDLIKG
mgnify:CR=1 FL=1